MNIYNKSIKLLSLAAYVLVGGFTTSVNAQAGITDPFQVQIKATQGTLFDNDNYLGTAATATNGYDASLDSPEPPAPPTSYVSVFFNRPDYGSLLGSKFSKDMRPVVNLTDTTQIWTFSVFSSNAGEVSLTLTFPEEFSVPVIIVDNSTNERVESVSSIVYTAAEGETRTFTVTIGDTTAPEITVGAFFEGPQIFETGVTRTLTWESTDRNGVTDQELSYSLNNGETWEVLSSDLADSFDWEIPATIELNYETLFKLSASDFGGNTTEVTTETPITLANATQTKTVAAGWNLVGLPLKDVSGTVAETFANVTDYWITYEWIQNAGYVQPETFTNKRGFWFGSLNENTLSATGTVLTTKDTIDVEMGWQILTNPLVTEVDLTMIKILFEAEKYDFSVAKENGWITGLSTLTETGYEDVTALSPWGAYWIGSTVDNLQLEVPIHAKVQQNVAKGTSTEELFSISSIDMNGIKSTIGIGFNETATIGFDKEFDVLTPPTPPNGSIVALQGIETILGNTYKALFFNLTEELEIPLVIKGSTEKVTISWTEYQFEGSAYLHVDEAVYSLLTAGSLEISKSNSVKVVINPVTTSTESMDNTPSSFSLEQNYPNPFNPETTIKFALPQSANVELAVYNALGQQVAVLVNEVKSAGTYSVRFDASALSSGMYFYKMQSGSFVQVNKMVLIK